MNSRRFVISLVGVALTASALIGCSTTEGAPAKESTSTTSSTSAGQSTTSSATATTTSATPAPSPTGPPIGTATMSVTGGTGPVTIRYQINGGPEQTETNVTLPWSKDYPVYDKLDTSVTADGGATELTCTIMMDGKLASFVTQPNPTCSFAYWG